MVSRHSVKETTNDVFEAAEEQIGSFADKAYEKGRESARAAVDHQRNVFKHFCQTVVRALRRGGDELRDEGYGTVAGLVDDVATRAEDLTEEIDDFDSRSVTDRVEDFVRERPLVAYGALAVAGFLVANTLHSASRHRNERVLEHDDEPEMDDDDAPSAPSRRPTTRKTKTKAN